MYYKVLKNNRVIDVLDHLVYLKWQDKHQIMILTDEIDAQAILSSDNKHIWHVEGMYDIPVDGYDTVQIEEINEYEYRQLRVLNYKTPEEIIDNFVLQMLEGGIL
mgnify:CR=1 FL=1